MGRGHDELGDNVWHRTERSFLAPLGFELAMADTADEENQATEKHAVDKRGNVAGLDHLGNPAARLVRRAATVAGNYRRGSWSNQDLRSRPRLPSRERG